MMKKILLACCLIAISSMTAMAQSAANNTQQNIDPKLMLVSKVNEFDALLTRGKAEQAQQVYGEIAGLLSQHMAAVHQEYAAAGNGKEELKKKIDMEQSIYTDTKIMSVDIKKNQKDMVAKFNSFLQNY